jgi:flagellar basal-body rod protein FlgG
MQHEAGTLFVPPAGGRSPVAAESRSVRQGFLEDSNVNTVGSMVDLITVQRSYAAVQRTITTLDGIRHTIANDLGKPV